MIVALVLFLLLVVFLAFFVGKNSQNLCTIWAFHEFSQVPVVTLVIIAFAVGVLCALLLTVFIKLKSDKKNEDDQSSKEKKKSAGSIFLRNKNKNKDISDPDNVSDQDTNSTVDEPSVDND